MRKPTIVIRRGASGENITLPNGDVFDFTGADHTTRGTVAEHLCKMARIVAPEMKEAA